jgi:cardiolipin synthase
VWLADGVWASVGTANLDNRSLLLNFEVNCLIYSPREVAELEKQFERDLEQSIRLEPTVFAKRPWGSKVAENFFRLFSPVL